MGGIVNKVVKVGSLGLIDDVTGMEAAQEASMKAAGTAADAQTQALNYLKEREALPQEYREAALTQLGGLYGLGGEDPTQTIQTLKQTPIYQAIVGGRGAGEEAIARVAGMTGGFRSGNIQDAFYDYNTQLENQALLQSMQGLQGMANLPSYAPQIAQGMAGIGQTRAMGIQGAGQAEQATTGMLMSGLANAAGAYFSDERLKTKVRKIGEQNGHNIYSWVWNKAAESLGLSGVGVGVLSKEVKEKNPDAIGEKYGYETVDYKKLGLI